MALFELTVYLPDGSISQTIAAVRRNDLADCLFDLMQQYPICERIGVAQDGAFLFAIDRDGNRIAS